MSSFSILLIYQILDIISFCHWLSLFLLRFSTHQIDYRIGLGLDMPSWLIYIRGGTLYMHKCIFYNIRICNIPSFLFCIYLMKDNSQISTCPIISSVMSPISLISAACNAMSFLASHNSPPIPATSCTITPCASSHVLAFLSSCCSAL